MTAFTSRFDNQTDKRLELEDFEALAVALRLLAGQPTYKPAKGDRSGKGAWLISPAVYRPETTRRNVNVVAWAGWAALDVDDSEWADLGQIKTKFAEYRTVIYSTGGSTEAKPKFRVIFELTEYVDAGRIPAFWHALNQEVAGVADAQTKDLSRMFYIPGQYPGAYNFFLETYGPPIAPGALIAKHPSLAKVAGKTVLERLPPDLQRKVISHRKAGLTAPPQTWTSYRDCPFVNKTMIAEYLSITGTGWYRKMYSLMVSIASNAVRRGYCITEKEIAHICRTLDEDNGGWYKKRNLEGEAARALEYVYRKVL